MTTETPASSTITKSDTEIPSINDCIQHLIQRYLETTEAAEHTGPGHLHALITDHVETNLITTVLDYYQGNQTKTANVLGISRATLRHKIKKLGILPEHSKE